MYARVIVQLRIIIITRRMIIWRGIKLITFSSYFLDSDRHLEIPRQRTIIEIRNSDKGVV